MLYSSGCSSAMGSALYWMGMDVHGPCYGWSMRQASAMLLVPDNLHGSHAGINKAMDLARTCVYWLGMQADVTDYIKQCLTCIESSNLPMEMLQPHKVPHGPWVKIGVDFFQDHLGKKTPNSSRLLQQVPICVPSGICTSFQDHHTPEGTLCCWRHTHYCHVWQQTPIQWWGIQAVCPWFWLHAHHIITPFPSIQWIYQGYGEEGQECLQENWWFSQCFKLEHYSSYVIHPSHQISLPQQKFYMDVLHKEQFFSRASKCVNIPQIQQKLIHLQEKEKENFDKAHRAKDLCVLKVKEKVQMFQNKQGTGPLKWTTGTVTEILECGCSYMVQGPWW